MAASINPILSGLAGIQAPANQNGKTSSDSGTTQVANMNTFLQLLVAQMKNQDPLNPTDGTQFVAQLAQFSQVEQTIAVRAGVEGMKKDLDQLVAALQTTDKTTQQA
jgi:flagellar hook assembly protein FlgD